ncbi:MAG: radical SAM protein, partial [Candidatus Helarchaeota archaeon]|nr:radical SAM protein [Candidatus Helarchaeota archaeon]
MTYYKEFENCNLCEWKCGINRYEEVGVCGVSGIPIVASSTLHPAPPSSYDAFLSGCNFRCLFCQNFSISTYPEGRYYREFEGYYEPYEWVKKAVNELNSKQAEWIRADRLFFTGGEPTIFLPWIEDVVREAKKIKKDIKMNFDTNGFMTLDSLKRIIKISTSITFDIKAFSDEVFRQLTGAFPAPVLRNAEYLIKNSAEKIWEIRVMIIPEIHNNE